MWIKVGQKYSSYTIGVIYRHPNQNIILFQDNLEQTLVVLNKTKESFLLLGI